MTIRRAGNFAASTGRTVSVMQACGPWGCQGHAALPAASAYN